MKSIYIFITFLCSFSLYANNLIVKNLSLIGQTDHGEVKWESIISENDFFSLNYQANHIEYQRDQELALNNSVSFLDKQVSVNFNNSQSYVLKNTTEIYLSRLNLNFNLSEKNLYLTIPLLEITLDGNHEIENFIASFKLGSINSGSIEIKSGKLEIGKVFLDGLVFSLRRNTRITQSNPLRNISILINNNQITGYFWFKYFINNKVYIRGDLNIDLKRKIIIVKLDNAWTKVLNVKSQLLRAVKTVKLGNLTVQDDKIIFTL